jgi:hypothetical protein
MHLVGRSMRVRATWPDGKVQELVNVPDWDFSWQETYLFARPLHLPRGTRLDLESSFDNSAANPRSC